MTKAFVLSGGGSLGAVQVGMLKALIERDIAPDMLIGTSAGAINAAFVAAHGYSRDSLDDLEGVWNGLRRQSVFPVDPLRSMLALTGRHSSLCSNDRLRRLVQTHLTVPLLEDMVIPLYVVTTDLMSGEEVVLSTGDVISAVLASSAIPGVLPPIERDGRTLVDGGITDNAALSQAVAHGADEIYVLPAGFACARDAAPTSLLGIGVQSLTILIERRLVREIADFQGPATIKVIPPLCPLKVVPIDFNHTAELIERAYVATGKWLDEGGPELPDPERFLSLHHH